MQNTLVQLTRDYLDALKVSGKSARTLYTYGKDIEQILAFFGNGKEIDKITLPQVGKFYRSDILLKLPNGKVRATQTIRKTVRVLRLFLCWAQSQGYIDTLPLPKSLPEMNRIHSDTILDLEANESVDDITQVITEALP